jgi:demethylmenaquinone methyltransferase / 2-methoxy-6-polyprenyl-1,4-benzoquinol methylase
MKGARPEGAHSERESAERVRAMFARIAHRYDLANHLLSLNIDRYWRAYTVRRVQVVLEKPGARVLDICCGTGDLMRALARKRGVGTAVMGSDFCHPMLVSARAKVGGGMLFEADALRLPVPGASLDLITVAFGFRNLSNYEAGLCEMLRVLRPGGIAAILEFSQPSNPIFGTLYGFYSRRILPVIGGALSGAPDAYKYLPDSVRKFPAPADLAESMRVAGFARVDYELLTGGIVALHLGWVSQG